MSWNHIEPLFLPVSAIFYCIFGLPALFESPQGTPSRCPSDPFGPVRLPGTAGSDSQPFQVITRSERTKRSQKSTKTSIFTQIGVAWSLVTQARGPETEIGRKIHKFQCQEQILRTIWLSSSSGSEKKLSLLFFGKKAYFAVHKTPPKKGQLWKLGGTS